MCVTPTTDAYVVRNNKTDVISALQEIAEKLLIWFSDNQIKLNTNKCHILLNAEDLNILKLVNFNIKNFFTEKLLGIVFDLQLKIQQRHRRYLQKATRKLNVLSRKVPYMDVSRRKVLMNAVLSNTLTTVSLLGFVIIVP